MGAGALIARRTDNHDYSQYRDEQHSNSYRYNSNSVRMFDSIGVIKLNAPQNRAPDRVGTVTRKKLWGSFKGGRYNESLVHKNRD